MRRIPLALALLALPALIACGGDAPTKSGGGTTPAKPATPATPEATVNHMIKSMGENRPAALWHALPASYQADVQGLIKEFTAKMDPQVYDKGAALVNKALGVLKDKKGLVLESLKSIPFVAMAIMGKDTKELENGMDGIVSMLSIITSSELSSLDQLKGLDMAAFLDKTGGQVMAKAMELSSLFPDPNFNKQKEGFLKSKATLVSKDGDKAEVKITDPSGKTKSVKMVKVEGKWLPEDGVKQWKAMIGEAKEKLAGLNKEEMAKSKDAILKQMAGFDQVLDMMAKAKNHQEFQMSLVPLMGGMGGGTPR